MDDMKGFFSSKTIWAGLVTMAASGLGLYGYHVSPADQASLVDLIASGVTLVSGAMAIWGRVVATKQIGGGK